MPGEGMSEIASATHPPTLGPQIDAGLGTPEGRGHTFAPGDRLLMKSTIL